MGDNGLIHHEVLTKNTKPAPKAGPDTASSNSPKKQLRSRSHDMTRTT